MRRILLTAWRRLGRTRGGRHADGSSLVTRGAAAVSIAAIAFVAGRAMEPVTSPTAAVHPPAATGVPGVRASATPQSSDPAPNPIKDPGKRAAVDRGLVKTLDRLRDTGAAHDLPPASVSRAIGGVGSVHLGPIGGPAVVTQLAANGIPSVTLQAYQDAAVEIDGQLPTCHLQWTLLAAIGTIESGNGRAQGARLTSQGDALPPILGPRLVGGSGMARISDTDGGRLDGDTAFDRAVGPMQFLPSTWAVVGVDGNGDGRADPNNVYDAALSAATYLCASGRDLGQPDQLHAAVLSYNHSAAYVAQVLALAVAYETNAPVALPLGPAPPATSSAPSGAGSASASLPTPTGPPTATDGTATGASSATASSAAAPTTSVSASPTVAATPTAPESSITPCPPSTPTSDPPTSDTTADPSGSAGSTSTPTSANPTASGSDVSSTATTTGSGVSTATPAGGSTTASAGSSTADATASSAEPTSTGANAPGEPTGLGVDPLSCGASLPATSLTPTLTAAAPAANADAITYDFQIWPDGQAAEPVASGSVTVAAGQQARWTVDPGILDDGTSYSYRVRATVAGLSSAWSGWFAFVVVG